MKIWYASTSILLKRNREDFSSLIQRYSFCDHQPFCLSEYSEDLEVRVYGSPAVDA
jgi:hypothetical protein